MFKKAILAAIISFGFLFIPSHSYAQAGVEEAVREVDRPMRKEIEEKIKIMPGKVPEIEKEKKTPAAEGPKFFIKKISLAGADSFSPAEFIALIERYENKEVSLEELNILAGKIEREYLRKGVIAACFIPPQDIKQGVVILQVVEAKMGELKIKDHPYFRKERIKYYWQIKPDEVIHYDKISRSLQAMNKNPDREVKATLYAGKTSRTTDILLDVDTSFPAHITSTFDREGVTSTGKYRKGLGMRHNNFLGLDDTLLTGYTFGDRFDAKYFYHSLPITNFGTSLLYGYSYSKSSPGKEFDFFGIDSRAKNISFFINQDLFKKEDYLGKVYFGIDAKDKTTKQNTGTTNRDRLRILRLGGNFVRQGFGSVTYISPEVSQGINLFGAQRRNALSSRAGKNTFSKFNLGIQHKKRLPLKLQASLKLKTQLSSTNLTPQEEFYLGGINSVRGYPSGDYLADNALQANLELLIPAFFLPEKMKLPLAKKRLKDDTTALLFFDYGWGRRRGSANAEKRTANLKSAGAGLRIRLFERALLRLEWGFPLGDNTITEEGKSRFHISLDFEM